MILLLRYSGLRISDASTLERVRLKGTKLFLYTQKTGTPVRVPLPQHVVDALTESPSDDPKYFFWNGRCLKMSAVKIWETTFKTVFEKTDIKGGHIHRFRDTFAVRLLEKGVSIETVSVLRPFQHRRHPEALPALGEIAAGQAGEGSRQRMGITRVKG